MTPGCTTSLQLPGGPAPASGDACRRARRRSDRAPAPAAPSLPAPPCGPHLPQAPTAQSQQFPCTLISLQAGTSLHATRLDWQEHAGQALGAVVQGRLKHRLASALHHRIAHPAGSRRCGGRRCPRGAAAAVQRRRLHDRRGGPAARCERRLSPLPAAEAVVISSVLRPAAHVTPKHATSAVHGCPRPMSACSA